MDEYYQPSDDSDNDTDRIIMLEDPNSIIVGYPPVHHPPTRTCAKCNCHLDPCYIFNMCRDCQKKDIQEKCPRLYQASLTWNAKCEETTAIIKEMVMKWETMDDLLEFMAPNFEKGYCCRLIARTNYLEERSIFEIKEHIEKISGGLFSVSLNDGVAIFVVPSQKDWLLPFALKTGREAYPTGDPISETAMQTLQEQNRKLQQQINELYCSPLGPGYVKLKTHWTKHAEDCWEKGGWNSD